MKSLIPFSGRLRRWEAANQMMLFRPAKSKIFGLVMLLLVMAAPMVITSVSAQEKQPEQKSNTTSVVTDNPTNQELAHASKEAADQEADETEPLKHSSSVQAIARLTGLSIDKAYWVLVGINFLILFVILWIMLKRNLPGAFKARTESIQKRMEEARTASEDARRRLSEVESRLSRLDAEIAQMKAEAEASARVEEQHIMEAAEEERRRIVQATEQEIASAANAARRELKALAAELSVDLAEKKIRITQDADRVLVREFTTQLGKDGQ
jgi:F-type H+-transporting ATPase subunit b